MWQSKVNEFLLRYNQNKPSLLRNIHLHLLENIPHDVKNIS